MFPRKYKKQNKIKKFILKLFNLYAYEKETLNMVNPSYKNVGKNLIKLNEKSFNFSKGYLELNRKILNEGSTQRLGSVLNDLVLKIWIIRFSKKK